MVNFNVRTKIKTIAMVICVFVCVVLVVVTKYVEFNRDMTFGFGSMVLPTSSFLGILQAVKGLICIIMVCIDYRIGKIMSLLYIGCSIVFMIMGMLRSGEMPHSNNLPRCVNELCLTINHVGLVLCFHGD